MSAIFGLPPPLMRLMATLMVAAVIALVAWALHLMQSANDRQDFSLMLAGCMVCSAAVGLSTVMVLTFTSPETFSTHLPTTTIEPLPSRSVDAGAAAISELPWEAITRHEAPNL